MTVKYAHPVFQLTSYFIFEMFYIYISGETKPIQIQTCPKLRTVTHKG